MVLTAEQFERFREVLERKTGILLGANKQYLVTSRLSSFIKEEGYEEFEYLLQKINHPTGNKVLQQVIDRMTTNETLWFRDSYPFEFLVKTVLTDLKKEGKDNVNIWCAACSSGQEPYSICMSIDEARRERGMLIPSGLEILGTDISNRVLGQATRGEYQSLEISRGLSEKRQKQHFEETEEGTFLINSRIKSRVKFTSFNLMKMPYYHFEKFEVIFCRNVLIYFSGDLKIQVIENLAKSLKPRGYLFLGASESMPSKIDSFEMVRCNPGLVYRKK